MLNLASNLDRTADIHGSEAALYFSDQRMSYAELNALANQVANALLERGIEPGDRVAISCPNIPYFPAIYYGILKVGAVVVPLNVLLKAREVEYHLQDCQARVYFCFEGSDELPVGEQGRQGFDGASACEHFVLITADPASASPYAHSKTLHELLHGQPVEMETVVTGCEDTALILYTSGTTGQPKGALLSHSNIAMNTLAVQSLAQINRSDVMLVCLPLFHAFGQIVQMNAAVLGGSAMVLVPRFDADSVFAAMQTHGVTFFAGVPTMYIALLNHPGVDRYDMAAIAGKLRIAVSGGASLPLEVLQQFEQRFDIPILEGYGLSETSPVATFNHLDVERVPGSVGQPLAGVQVRIVAEDGDEVECGELGEVLIRGHNVMSGYFNRPEATSEAIRGGWFHSGDIGRVDERGYLYIVDRLKEMIIRGGYNVYPREIEEVLMAHPAVVMVAVVGMPDARLGEEIKAFVVAADGFADAEALQVWARERLADYKYPREIEFRDSLPMTATGKLLKKELRA